MRPGLKIGHVYTYDIVVDESMIAQLNGIVVHPLYSTAAMITHLEWAARQHILPYLEAHEEGVGYHIDVRHMSPTPLGVTVTLRSEVTAIDENKITSAVLASHAKAKIGEGFITQAIVPLAEFETTYQAATDSDEDVLRPAVLWSSDLQSSFGLTVCHWASGFPCTRYDEWLVCEVVLKSPDLNASHKGPFLVHYEIVELIEALMGLASGRLTKYEPEHLETLFALNIQAEGDLFRVSVKLAPPGETPALVSFLCPQEALNHLARALSYGIGRFPSLL